MDSQRFQSDANKNLTYPDCPYHRANMGSKQAKPSSLNPLPIVLNFLVHCFLNHLRSAIAKYRCTDFGWSSFLCGSSWNWPGCLSMDWHLILFLILLDFVLLMLVLFPKVLLAIEVLPHRLPLPIGSGSQAFASLQECLPYTQLPRSFAHPQRTIQ